MLGYAQPAFDQESEIKELTLGEIDEVSGGDVTASEVLAVGAAITGGAALILAAPAIVGVTGTAAAVYGGVSAAMALGSAIAAMAE